MSKKVVQTVLQLKDKFSQPILKSSKNTRSFQRQVKKTKNSIKKFKNGAVSDFKSVAKSAIGLGTAYIGFNAIKTGLSDCVSEAKNMIEAETKLAAVFKATGKATADEIAALSAHSDMLEKQGVIGADVTTAFQQQLATYNLTAESVKALSEGSLDLIAQMKGANAAQADGVNVGNMLGKVLSGQLGALSRAGISFDEAQEKVLKYGTEQEKVATLAKVLEQNVGGVNKALLETDDGKIVAMNHKFGAYKEMIGRKILPLQAKFASWFATKIPAIEAITLKLFSAGEKAVEKLVPQIRKLWAWLKKAFKSDAMKAFIKILFKVKEIVMKVAKEAYKMAKYFIENWRKFEPIIYGVVGAFAAYKAIMLVAKTVMIAVKIAQLAINLAMNANPIGLVCLAIGALIAIGVALYKNWDVIKLKVTELWDRFKGFIADISERFPLLGIIIENTIEKWKGIIEGLKTTFKGIVDFISGVFSGDWEKAWEGVKGIFKGVFDTFYSIAKTPINGVIDLMNLLIDKLNGFSFDIPDWFGGEIGGQSVGFNLPKIPRLALGTTFSKGGLTEIHDGAHGGEIVDLPNGSRVIPADKSKKIVEKSGGITVYVTIEGNVIGNEQFVDDVGNKVAKKIKEAIDNV
ncbi:hypothetical protein EZV73_26605 [Acidaminobacter sp. JC074]|uniref:hypothetical protein n=1 Tax=Acidaminobacter sp. JC074 TaxID=2530199 RepID=UPI001F0FD0A5|nr:hypothetical protein [Acidaminobacter sp. JC074]MCH4891178.1 hypothetical protein [Acidaminobacter sp. JC074]